MKFESNKIYHIFNQGNNQETIFLEDAHFLSFMKLYQANIALHCETIAWCLMSNHFHFLIFTDERCMQMIKQGGLLLDPITNGFRKALSNYSHEFNKKNDRSGALFRPKTKAICLDDEMELERFKGSKQNYYKNAFEYLHENPVAAGIVASQADWKWSSARAYAGRRVETICNMELTGQLMGW